MKDSRKPGHEMITDETEASGDSDGEDDEGDNFEAIPDYGSSFGVQQVSAMLDTPAHQRAGRNKNIVIVGSQLSKLTYSFTRRRVQDDW
jgi:transketolase N-terminal domain/subunit